MRKQRSEERETNLMFGRARNFVDHGCTQRLMKGELKKQSEVRKPLFRNELLHNIWCRFMRGLLLFPFYVLHWDHHSQLQRFFPPKSTLSFCLFFEKKLIIFNKLSIFLRSLCLSDLVMVKINSFLIILISRFHFSSSITDFFKN